MIYSNEESDLLEIVDPFAFDKVEGHIILTNGTNIIMAEGSDSLFWHHQVFKSPLLAEDAAHFLGFYNQQPCFSLVVDDEILVALKAQKQSLYSYLGTVPDALFRLLGRAVQINDWYQSHRYCGRCGVKTSPVDNERAMGCKTCEVTYYPRLSPCIMALITRGPECLLARNVQWQKPLFSVLAGFVEPGESIEHALKREVLEEVGLKVENLHYFSSQPWPFPGQLMMGFFVDYQGGDIRIDDVEIAEAHWFHYQKLPSIPGTFSLSGQLINAFMEQSRDRYGI